MKVYVVLRANDYEGPEIEAVFSNKPDAVKYAEQRSNIYAGTRNNITRTDDTWNIGKSSHVTIESYEVDEFSSKLL